MSGSEMSDDSVEDYWVLPPFLTRSPSEIERERMVSVDIPIIQNAKNKILNAFVDLDTETVEYMIKYWILDEKFAADLEKLQKIKKDLCKLETVNSELAKIIPPSGIVPSVNIELPNGVNADCSKDVTIHIDKFVYDEKSIDDMVDKGKVSRHYCSDCKSQNVKKLKILSHSFSQNCLAYLFNFLLPMDLSKYQLLDIGSGIGAVVFGSYHLSNFQSIIGVEISEELCNIQNNIIDTCKLDTKRIQIINSDILKQSDVIKKSDYIIMNNVFECSTDVEKQKEIWYFLKNTMKEDTFLITVPNLKEVLENLGIVDDFMFWLEPVREFHYDDEALFNVSEGEFADIYFYKVQRKEGVSGVHSYWKKWPKNWL